MSRLKKATRNTIYTILTNKTYIRVKEINKHNGSPTEEVPAVWEPIIDEETFNSAQTELKKNRTRAPSHAEDGRYVYLFSSLFRCGICGVKLQGKRRVVEFRQAASLLLTSRNLLEAASQPNSRRSRTFSRFRLAPGHRDYRRPIRRAPSGRNHEDQPTDRRIARRGDKDRTRID